MKTTTFFYIIIAFGLSISVKLTAQNITEIPKSIIREEISLFTDRDYYITGESILFQAFYRITPALSGKQWSSVIYIELIKPDGTPVEQAKIKLKQDGASGQIEVPASVVSGIYYIKAYTRWMRNFSVENYAYRKIKIINPLNASTLASNPADLEKNFTKIPATETFIKIKTDKPVYQTREDVQLEISSNTALQSGRTYSVSVVKKGVVDFNNHIKYPFSIDSITDGYARFLPDLDGIILSGQLTNGSTKEPIKDVLVYMVSFKDTAFLANYETDKNGMFYFNLPGNSGSQELLLEANSGSESMITVDAEYCKRPVSLPTEKFTLSENEIRLMEEYAVNTQLTSIFKSSIPPATKAGKNEISFYGSPVKVIYTKDYIDLPYLEEFIFELITQFEITSRKGISGINTRERNSFSGMPVLTMVDNVPVLNLNDFFKIRTNKMERIEFINRPYILGNQKYNGIIHAISNTRDLSEIKLPENSVFLNYMHLTPQPFNGNTTAESSNDLKIPDRRNTLYWNPAIQFDASNKVDILFKTADLKGEYEVIIQSYDWTSNKVLYSLTNFTVE